MMTMEEKVNKLKELFPNKANFSAVFPLGPHGILLYYFDDVLVFMCYPSNCWQLMSKHTYDKCTVKYIIKKEKK